MADFKFNIGDVLIHRGNLNPWRLLYAERLFVVERFKQECYGGLQNHYHCRVIRPSPHGSPSVSEKLLSVVESELDVYPNDRLEDEEDEVWGKLKRATRAFTKAEAEFKHGTTEERSAG